MDESNLDEFRSKCLNSLKSCVENISTYLGDDNVEYDKVTTLVKEYCKMEHIDEASTLAIAAAENESDITDWDSLQQLYQEKLAQLMNKHVKFDRHSLVKEFEKHIRNAKRKKQSEDSEFAITETVDKYTDPISKKPINNPMRNKICKHVYEKETIESIIKNKTNKGCPYVGCTNKKVMLAKDLKLDEKLQLTIQLTQQVSQEY